MVSNEPACDEIRSNLWNREPNSNQRGVTSDAALLEQFKLYVESADRVSHRRGMANTFFLSLNSLVVVTVGGLLGNAGNVPPWFLLFPLIALEGMCWAWYGIVKSYGQLNAAKWKIVGVLEERLPVSPWKTEWEVALGKGKDPARYRPLTRVEKRVPIVFAAVYFGAFIAAWFL